MGEEREKEMREHTSAGTVVREKKNGHVLCRASLGDTVEKTTVTLYHKSLGLDPILLSTVMSQAHPIASSSSNFQSVFNAALEAYEKKTKCKLLSHPLAAQLQSCDNPIAILSVLQDLIQQFDRRRRSDERLTNWLSPTVNVLYAFSDFIAQGVGLVSLHLGISL